MALIKDTECKASVLDVFDFDQTLATLSPHEPQDITALPGPEFVVGGGRRRLRRGREGAQPGDVGLDVAAGRCVRRRLEGGSLGGRERRGRQGRSPRVRAQG